MGSLLDRDADEELAAFELDAVQLFQNERDAWLGDVDKGLRVLEVNRADRTFGNGGDARDHADEIAGRNGVGAADVERETDHTRFVRDGAGFLTRVGAPGTFVFIAASLSARVGGGVGVAALGASRSMS